MPSHAMRMAVPAMKPSSWMPRKSVSIEDEERARRGEGADQHAGPGAGRGELEGLAQAAAQEDLLLVAEEEVDAVVDADARPRSR